MPGSDPMTLVLLGVRLQCPVETVALERRLAIDEAHLASLLGRAAAAGWVRHHDGRLPGWALTGDGRAEGERLLSAELDGAGARPAVAEAYNDFRVLNAQLLELCTDWQLRPDGGERVPNDHADAVYDKGVVVRLSELTDASVPLTDALTVALDRFSGYGPRLQVACHRVEDGDGEWFTKPTIDSFHSVWFELHENLLATLGIDRASESPET